MENSQLLVFDANDLIQLLTHYTQGRVPLNTKLLSVGTSQFLQRWIGLECESNQWAEGDGAIAGTDALSPLHIRYEGCKILKLGNQDQAPVWEDAPQRGDLS